MQALLIFFILGVLAFLGMKSGLLQNLGIGIEEEQQRIEQGSVNVPSHAVSAGTTSNQTPTEPRTEQIFIAGDPAIALTYLGTTEYFEDLYVGHDPANGLKFLHKERENYQATTYPVFRAYPDSYTNEEILADYSAGLKGEGIEPWFGKRPVLSDDFFQALLSSNLATTDERYRVILPDWFVVPEECFDYIPRDKCRFTITDPNPYGLPAATLTNETGPYLWPGELTPYEFYVTMDKKVLIRWGFGDAGAYAKYETLWDPTQGTHQFLHSASGMIEEQSNVKLPNKEYTVAYVANGYATTTPMLKLNPFKDLRVYGRPLRSDCYAVSFHPTNSFDASAPWLLEYTYGCYADEQEMSGLTVWYRLDPVQDRVEPLSGLLPK